MVFAGQADAPHLGFTEPEFAPPTAALASIAEQPGVSAAPRPGAACAADTEAYTSGGEAHEDAPAGDAPALSALGQAVTQSEKQLDVTSGRPAEGAAPQGGAGLSADEGPGDGACAAAAEGAQASSSAPASLPAPGAGHSLGKPPPLTDEQLKSTALSR